MWNSYLKVSIWIKWVAREDHLWAIVGGVQNHRAVSELFHERILALHSYSTCSASGFSRGTAKFVDELAYDISAILSS